MHQNATISFKNELQLILTFGNVFTKEYVFEKEQVYYKICKMSRHSLKL